MLHPKHDGRGGPRDTCVARQVALRDPSDVGPRKRVGVTGRAGDTGQHVDPKREDLRIAGVQVLAGTLQIGGSGG
jgi:hypothetical protein